MHAWREQQGKGAHHVGDIFGRAGSGGLWREPAGSPMAGRRALGRLGGGQLRGRLGILRGHGRSDPGNADRVRQLPAARGLPQPRHGIDVRVRLRSGVWRILRLFGRPGSSPPSTPALWPSSRTRRSPGLSSPAATRCAATAGAGRRCSASRARRSASTSGSPSNPSSAPAASGRWAGTAASAPRSTPASWSSTKAASSTIRTPTTTTCPTSSRSRASATWWCPIRRMPTTSASGRRRLHHR